MANSLDIRVTAGAWLGPVKAKNEEEIEALISLVRQDIGIESVIVGNKVLLRGDLTETELIAYIEQVKQTVLPPAIRKIAAIFSPVILKGGLWLRGDGFAADLAN